MLLSYVFQKMFSVPPSWDMTTCIHVHIDTYMCITYIYITIIDAHTHTETRNYAHSTKPPLKSCNVWRDSHSAIRLRSHLKSLRRSEDVLTVLGVSSLAHPPDPHPLRLRISHPISSFWRPWHHRSYWTNHQAHQTANSNQCLSGKKDNIRW